MMISNIQHGSTSDVPGLRTTVFCAGCNLRCGWCHNPETWSARPGLLFYAAKCARCGVCAQLCPNGAVSFRDGTRSFDPSRCLACGRCVSLCPTGAVELSCREMTEDAVFAELEKDLPFYESSGGGVTFSGGEPLLQAEACVRLADRCRAAGITVLLDTAGCVPGEVWREALPHFDFVYLDAKTVDAESCARFTGGDFERITENMVYACRNHPGVTIRAPLIPGVSLERVGELGELLLRVGADRVCLLPFHRLGSGKYRAMGLEYPYRDQEPLPRERLRAAADILREMGLKEVWTE